MSGLRNFLNNWRKKRQRKAARAKRGSPYKHTPASGWDELKNQQAKQLWIQTQRAR